MRPREPDPRPRFGRRRDPTPTGNGRVWGMIALLLVVGLVIVLRGAWEPRLPEGVAVEVVGEVPRPGWHHLVEPTLAEAVRAAGGAIEGLPDTPLHLGDRVVVGPEGVRVAPGGDPLLVALPVDVNVAGADALQAIPGVGESLAEAVVADRQERGPFYAIEDLLRVRGVGPSLLQRIEPFLTVGDVGPRPPPPLIDLNRATASELESLPGIGPVTAARIIVDREDRGPYRRLADLQRVRGIGPRTVERIEGLATVEEAP